MIKVKKLTKVYNDRKILDDCSFTLNTGIYGLLGRNGAGKTTLLKSILGLVNIDSGYTSILDCGSIKDNILLLKDIGITIETPKHYLHLSAKENISLHLSYLNYPLDKQDSLILEVLTKVGLEKEGDKRVADFSLGMKQRLAIARAIVHQPRILILDEPINGLDPLSIKKMRDLFINLLEEKDMLILFSSHILQEVFMVSDYILVLNDGKIVFNQPISSLDPENYEEQLIKLMEEK